MVMDIFYFLQMIISAFDHHLLHRRRCAVRILRAYLTTNMSSTDNTDDDESNASDLSRSISPSVSDLLTQSNAGESRAESESDSDSHTPPSRRPRLDLNS